MIWITVLFYTASIISLVVSCTPRERIWKPWVKGRCINRKAMGVVTAIFNAVLDLLMVALPLRVIWSLRIDRRRKLRISLVFSVGLMATACAVGRAVVSFDIIYTIGDSTYTMTPLRPARPVPAGLAQNFCGSESSEKPLPFLELLDTGVCCRWR
jgi:hypothetical protein